MELRHLRYFLTVAEQLHFARAAEMLGIAPPTLSVQIQEMERKLQVQLFVRTKRSVALTSAGEAFAEEARGVLAQFEQALHVGRRAGRGELGRVEIGYVGSAMFGGILQQQISAFRRQWPDAEVQAREWQMDRLSEALEEGRVDVAFVRMPLALAPSLQTHVLLRDRFAWRCRPTTRWRRRRGKQSRPGRWRAKPLSCPSRNWARVKSAAAAASLRAARAGPAACWRCWPKFRLAPVWRWCQAC